MEGALARDERPIRIGPRPTEGASHASLIASPRTVLTGYVGLRLHSSTTRPARREPLAPRDKGLRGDAVREGYTARQLVERANPSNYNRSAAQENAASGRGRGCKCDSPQHVCRGSAEGGGHVSRVSKSRAQSVPRRYPDPLQLNFKASA